MSDIRLLAEAESQFLQPYLPPPKQDARAVLPRATFTAERRNDHRPFVTLTYACSMDSMITLAPGVRTTLSGPDTKSMTHYLRLHHDAILIGVGTAIADDPSLSCRYPGATKHDQPRPVVVDPYLRWNARESMLNQRATNEIDQLPLIIHAVQGVDMGGDTNNTLRFLKLFIDEQRRMTIGLFPRTEPRVDSALRIEWPAILHTLKSMGINSVMIEGGATIINDLLARPDLVDSVIVTVAPTWLGQGGVVVSPNARTEQGQRVNAARLQQTAWRQFGDDVVVCGRLISRDLET